MLNTESRDIQLQAQQLIFLQSTCSLPSITTRGLHSKSNQILHSRVGTILSHLRYFEPRPSALSLRRLQNGNYKRHDDISTGQKVSLYSNKRKFTPQQAVDKLRDIMNAVKWTTSNSFPSVGSSVHVCWSSKKSSLLNQEMIFVHILDPDT